MIAAAQTPMVPRGVGKRTLAALFLALVAAILGAMPGWKMCFAAWLVFSWTVLGCIVLSSVFLAMFAAMGLDFAALRAEGRQILNVALLMLAMLPLGWLSVGVEFAQARADLRAQADASARAGGPRLAMTSRSGADWPLPASGFIYDADAVLARPTAQRPAAWNDSPVMAALASECLTATHLVGHWYRWSSGCDGL